MPCVHNFVGLARCETCAEPAIAFLAAEVRRLDASARAAVGFLVLGDRVKAEAELRAATAATPLFGVPFQLQTTTREKDS